MKSKTDYDELWETFPDVETWKKCVKEHLWLQKHTEYLSSAINDLTLSLELWIDGYPFDEDHKAKQKMLIDRACMMIGKPRTIEELATMLDLDDRYVELARQRDKELKA